MAAVANNYAVMVTMGFTSFDQNWDCVVPMVPDAAVLPDEATGDVDARILAAWIPKWVLILTPNTYCRGYRIEGMVKGKIFPWRRIFDAATHPGTVGGDEYPSSTSMMLAFYASNQVQAGPRRVTAKNFVGPPPESKASGNSIISAFHAGVVTDLATAIGAPFVGAVSGITWRRALTVDHVPGQLIDNCDTFRARIYLGTQRLRARPAL